MMSANVTVKGTLAEAGKPIKRQFANAIRRAAIELQKMVQKTLRTQSNRQGTVPSAPNSPPHRGHSTLMSSIVHEHVRTTDTEVTYRVGSYLKYAKIQETGGTITSLKRMTVPVSKQAKRHLYKGGTLWDFPIQLTTIFAKAGKQLLVEKKKRKTVVHFLLTNTVKLPPRPYLKPTASGAEFQSKLWKLFTPAPSDMTIDVT